jgi:hypothetical protein
VVTEPVSVSVIEEDDPFAVLIDPSSGEVVAKPEYSKASATPPVTVSDRLTVMVVTAPETFRACQSSMSFFVPGVPPWDVTFVHVAPVCVILLTCGPPLPESYRPT